MKKEEQQSLPRKSKKKKNNNNNSLDKSMCKSTWAFLSFTYQILPTSSFLSILIIKHFDRIREKTPRSYQFFFSLLPPTKHPSKKFSFSFSLQSFSSTLFHLQTNTSYKYKSLWDVDGKNRDSSFQRRVSHTYTLKLC